MIIKRFVGFFKDKNRLMLTKGVALFELSVVVVFIILLATGFFWS